MNELMITIPVPGGDDITMPMPQMLGIRECIELIKLTPPGGQPVWHANGCGCCYSVHRAGPDVDGGYVVGRDGNYSWHDIEPRGEGH